MAKNQIDYTLKMSADMSGLGELLDAIKKLEKFQNLSVDAKQAIANQENRYKKLNKEVTDKGKIQDFKEYNSLGVIVKDICTQLSTLIKNLQGVNPELVKLDNELENLIKEVKEDRTKFKVKEGVMHREYKPGEEHDYYAKGLNDIVKKNHLMMGDTPITTFKKYQENLSKLDINKVKKVNEQIAAAKEQWDSDYSSKNPQDLINKEKAIKAKQKEIANFKVDKMTTDVGTCIIKARNIKDSVQGVKDQYRLNQEISAGKRQGGEEAVSGKVVNDVLNAPQQKPGVLSRVLKTYFGYQMILRQLNRIVRTTIKTITELDKALTQQAMVSGMSRQETQKLTSSYHKLAGELGATATEVASVATKYFQQGKTAKEALILTEAAVSAAKVAGISTSKSVDYLTTALNGFQMTAQEAISVSDRFAALAATSATDYEELAIALSKVASQANLAGMSMDFTLGLLAKGIETTREAPETIGTALKTIIARMREMTDYGKTMEDGITVNNVEKQLQYVGIALRDANGELRSTEEVLDEIGRNWDSFSKNQQAALAKALAGTRQQSRLISMMQNYDRTLELVNSSQDSAGATTAQLSKYLDGLEGSLNRLKSAWQEFTTSLINSDHLVGIIDWLARIIKNLNWTKVIIYGIILLLPKIIKGIMGIASAIKAVGVAAKVAAITSGNVVAIITTILGVVLLLVDSLINMKTEAEKLEESFAKTSLAFYEWNKQAKGINQVIANYEHFDKLIIKTDADIKKMHEDLIKAGEFLDEDEKEYYESLETDAAKFNYLKEVKRKHDDEKDTTFDNQEREFYNSWNQSNETARKDFRNSVEARSSLEAFLQEKMNESSLDNDIKQTIKELAGQMSAEELEKFINKDFKIFNDKTIQKNLSQLNSTSWNEQYEALTNLLNSNAPEELKSAIKEEKKTLLELETLYKGDELNQILEWFDDSPIDMNNFHDFEEAIYSLPEVLQHIIDPKEVLQKLASKKSIPEIINDYLFGRTDKEKEKIKNAFSQLLPTNAEIAEQVTSLENQASGWWKNYDKFLKGEMSQYEKNSFVDEYLGGDWSKLEELAQGAEPSKFLEEYMEKTANKAIKEIDFLIANTTDKHWKNELEKIKAKLTNKQFYQRSLKDRVEQQKQILDLEKDRLNKEKDNLVKNLEERKKAYESYFKKIEEMGEVKDYEKERTRLVNQITRLSGATDANSLNKILELEKELKDLDEQYDKDQTTQAQEALTNNIDSEIESLNKKYDDLIKNDRELWDQLQKDADKGLDRLLIRYKDYITEMESLMTSESFQMKFQDMVKQLQSVGNNKYSNAAADATNAQSNTTNNTNNVYVSGQSVNNDTFVQAIFAVMREYGFNI